MKYTAEQYKTLAERFNKNSFLGKVILIKQNSDIFTIESDGYNLALRLEHEAMNLELDRLFEFPSQFDFNSLRDIFKLIDINIKEWK